MRERNRQTDRGDKRAVSLQVPDESRRERERGGWGERKTDRQTEVTNEPYHFKSRMSLRER